MKTTFRASGRSTIILFGESKLTIIRCPWWLSNGTNKSSPLRHRELLRRSTNIHFEFDGGIVSIGPTLGDGVGPPSVRPANESCISGAGFGNQGSSDLFSVNYHIFDAACIAYGVIGQ